LVARISKLFALFIIFIIYIITGSTKYFLDLHLAKYLDASAKTCMCIYFDWFFYIIHIFYSQFTRTIYRLHCQIYYAILFIISFFIIFGMCNIAGSVLLHEYNALSFITHAFSNWKIVNLNVYCSWIFYYILCLEIYCHYIHLSFFSYYFYFLLILIHARMHAKAK